MLFVRGVTLPQAYQSYVACLKSYRGISKTYQRAPWIRLVVFKAECLKCFLGWEKCKSYWCIQRRKRKRRCKVGEIHRITFNSGRKNKIDWLHWWLGTRFHQVMLGWSKHDSKSLKAQFSKYSTQLNLLIYRLSWIKFTQRFQLLFNLRVVFSRADILRQTKLGDKSFIRHKVTNYTKL